ncbi:tyrosine-type recombinase/integrase [Diplocloster agilis]|uniref:Tyrosine-type recombinase/integrase n=2 Tax=Diplocloster agilis TaxID=2850323 RepID=A0A949NFY1_9FIRM|nr:MULTISPECIES: tyrosine-type recombinase/integrase [Lachnospiraceae]MBU9735738.1 tyrosine-type recombinase/integrase [Diplocloster agilis]MCU6732476.1 tyrosine-type recombinase/integrase [Suonthocola fibrivorans]SCI48237.1 Tyrosine recombinase XerD [uncultured Clostridium sp.]
MTGTALTEYEIYLLSEERSANTIEKYIRDVRAFFTFLGNSELCKEIVLGWKEQLTRSYAPASVNSMLASLNSFLTWSGLPHLKVKPLKIQRDFYTKPEKELTHAEYGRLIRAAQKKQNDRLALLLQTICATGIRVSELKFITVDAMCTGRATVDCKGKTRTVFLPKELCRILRHYCKKQNIEKGSIFCTSSGTPLDRTNIWRDMKSLCKSAGVEPGKVFPHNLRHLFARTYYQLEKDLSRLADLLGHSSLTTTRIYTMESGIEHEKLLNRMNLVLAKK